MKKAILPLFFAAVLPLLNHDASAQISFGGNPIGQSALKSSLPTPPVQVLPGVDAISLMVEDAERASTGDKSLRFGKNHATDLTLDNSGVWSTLPNGDRVWRLGIECPGALSINFEFNTYVVPEGGQVFAYNIMGDVLGSFTAASNPGHTELGVGLLSGDHITVEYIEPATAVGQGQLRIGQVTHGYRDLMGLMKGFGGSGACNNNVICPINAGYEDQIRSVAIMLSGGSGFCTGQLLDNCAHDGTPYFLTANHCMVGNPATWVFRFNWNSPTCTPTANTTVNQSVSGASTLAQGPGSDYALLLLNTAPPSAYNVFFSGWDKSGAFPTETRAIHHPSGDIKKFSIDNEAPGQGTVNFGNGNAQCWHIFNWDDGTTEQGSSGSGLWDQNGRLVGQLYGGQANCNNNVNDYYGRFDITYPNIAQWLGNCGNAIDGLGGSSSVGDALTLQGVTVFPNPANGEFTIGLPSNVKGAVRLRVTDAVGRVVKDITSMTSSPVMQLDLASPADGVYTLEVLAGGASSVQRLIVQH